MSERRAHPRYDIRFGAEVKVDGEVVEAATHDVSRGGCRLESSRPLPEGQMLHLELAVMIDGIQDPDFPHLPTRVSVIWTAEAESEGEQVYLSGVQFQDLTEAQGDWLESILRRAS